MIVLFHDGLEWEVADIHDSYGVTLWRTHKAESALHAYAVIAVAESLRYLAGGRGGNNNTERVKQLWLHIDRLRASEGDEA